MNTLDFLPNKFVYFIDDFDGIVKMEYQQFLREFYSDETTTPNGIAPRLFVEFLTVEEIEERGESEIYIKDDNNYYSIEEIKRYADYENCKFYNIDHCDEIGIYTISTWGCCGNNKKIGTDYFSTNEAAKYELLLYWQFNKDNGNSYIEIFETFEEAENNFIKQKADEWEVSLKVAKSILRKKNCLDKIREEKEQREKIRVEKLANIYAEMIQPLENESYQDTCKRLSIAIGEKIEGKVFHKAVKLIRNKLNF